MWHGWHSYMRSVGESPPAIDKALLGRVAGYGRPYLGQLVGVLITVVLISALSVVPPILIRFLIDEAIPQGDLGALTWLGIGMVAVPVVIAGVGIIQRWWSSHAGKALSSIFAGSCTPTCSACHSAFSPTPGQAN